ncbi:MAG: hypothetical protein EOM50_18070 [Erysipelotrichia bacterium]|jgi:hypothetical protein|nr:hypothetical protein [Erysipelotrichia bacterium]
MYSVITANIHLDDFIDTYLSVDDFNRFLNTLETLPHTRPYWGNTKYKYIISSKIYFLYDIDDINKYVLILGVKFNNQRKTFNFGKTPQQIKTLNKWIKNKEKNK